MGKTALLFPGQGSLSETMGRDLLGLVFRSESMEASVSRLVKTDIWSVIKDIRHAHVAHVQPAIVFQSALAALALRHAGIKADGYAGHSLGEYTALFASGALDFDDMIRLVVARAQAMDTASSLVSGGMTAVLGPDHDTVRSVLEDSGLSDVVIANLNAPGQTVISGSLSSLERVSEIIRTKTSARLVALDVKGGFHSPLMAEAADALRTKLDPITFEEPHTPLYMTTTASRVSTQTIKDVLVRHMTETVRFEDMIRTMVDDGYTTFVEAGPGTVLSGLVKRIDRSVRIVSVQTKEDIITLKGSII
jgi:[acyl-carrier-protein] S-malonyltransferase